MDHRADEAWVLGVHANSISGLVSSLVALSTTLASFIRPQAR